MPDREDIETTLQRCIDNDSGSEAICEVCEQPTTRPYVHPVEGMDFCAPCVAALLAAERDEARAARDDLISAVTEALGRPYDEARALLRYVLARTRSNDPEEGTHA